jgi:hypothetical protein
VALLLAACSEATPENRGELAITAAMQTAEAMMTQTAALQSLQEVTSTPEPSATLTPALTSSPTQTQLAPSSGGAPSCDVAGFVADITIPDGTEMAAGTAFTKVWSLRNEGSCTWTPDYQLIFYSGEAMGGAAVYPFASESVAPGETIDVSVDLVAPAVAGHYVGYWTLRNASGVNFGVYGSPFYVEIYVVDTGKTYTPTPTFTEIARPTSTPEPTMTPTATIEPYPDPIDTAVPYPYP